MFTTSDVVIVINALFCCLSLFTATTRLRHTWQKIQAFQIHDVLLICALVSGILEAVLQCVETKYGLGSIHGDIQPDQAMIYSKLYLALFVFYLTCNMFVKLSLLAFYRLLSRNGRYFWIICIMAVVAILFGVSSILVTILQCFPLARVWTPELNGTCINMEAFYYYNGSFMILNDVVLYILPILIVRDVQLSKAKAAAMNFLFALGFVVVLASCMRLLAVHNLFTYPDRSLYYSAILLIWCTIENHLAIIIICLPAVKTVVVAVAGSLGSGENSVWSSMVRRRRSEVPQHIGVLPDTLPRRLSKKSNSSSSWWSFSSDKRKESFPSVSRSRDLPVRAHGSIDEVHLNKLPSISVSAVDDDALTLDSTSVAESQRQERLPSFSERRQDV